jgi:hypothetical protein
LKTLVSKLNNDFVRDYNRLRLFVEKINARPVAYTKLGISKMPSFTIETSGSAEIVKKGVSETFTSRKFNVTEFWQSKPWLHRISNSYDKSQLLSEMPSFLSFYNECTKVGEKKLAEIDIGDDLELVAPVVTVKPSIHWLPAINDLKGQDVAWVHFSIYSEMQCKYKPKLQIDSFKSYTYKPEIPEKKIKVARKKLAAFNALAQEFDAVEKERKHLEKVKKDSLKFSTQLASLTDKYQDLYIKYQQKKSEAIKDLRRNAKTILAELQIKNKSILSSLTKKVANKKVLLQKLGAKKQQIGRSIAKKFEPIERVKAIRNEARLDENLRLKDLACKLNLNYSEHKGHGQISLTCEHCKYKINGWLDLTGCLRFGSENRIGSPFCFDLSKKQRSQVYCRNCKHFSWFNCPGV